MSKIYGMHGFQDDPFFQSFKELLSWRRDVRSFQGTPISEELLHELLALACLAPSVGFSQPWRFLLVKSSHLREKVYENFQKANHEALTQYEGQRATAYAKLKLAGLREAPVHLAVFAQLDPSWGSGLGRRTVPETIEYSVVTAIHTLWLAARTKGIGVGWVSILDPLELSESLDVPSDWKFIAYLCIGYPSQESVQPELERKGWEEKHQLREVLFER